MFDTAFTRLGALLLLLLLAMPLPCSAESTVPERTAPELRIQGVEQQYLGLQSLEFDFSQATFTGGRIREGSGHAVFFRPVGPTSNGDRPLDPGIMRWDYTEPTVQTIINDGQELSIHTPQDKQLIVSPINDLETDITYALFTGTGSLLEAFEAGPPDPLFLLTPAPDDVEAVLLTPRQPHPQIKRIQLWLNSDMVMQRLLMEDHFDALTELTFTDIRFNTLPTDNPQVRQSLLQLDLTPGTDIIRQ